MACMMMTKTAKPIAILRARVRRPAVIIETKSRQASRDSWRANHTALPAWVIIARQRKTSCRFGRKRSIGDEREEGIFEARQVAGAFTDVSADSQPPQLGKRALGKEPAVRDDPDPVGHAFGDFQNVRGHDDGAAGADAFAQHALDLTRGAGVENG